eukprot:7143786-Alexandrium_andersonii.AAC.1
MTLRPGVAVRTECPRPLLRARTLSLSVGVRVLRSRRANLVCVHSLVQMFVPAPFSRQPALVLSRVM